MNRDEANAVAQELVVSIVDAFVEHEPCVALLTMDAEMHVAPLNGLHPIDILHDAALVAGEPWIGVVVVADGTARDLETGEDHGRVRTITACFAGKWADLLLRMDGVTRGTGRPSGNIPDAMAACMRTPPA